MIIGEKGTPVAITLTGEVFDTRTWRRNIMLADYAGNTVFLNLDKNERAELRARLDELDADA